jgi:DNA-binding MurR/RpiR family transcriptional regulator
LFQKGGGAVPLGSIWEEIDRRYGEFSPQLRRVAQFVRNNPQDVALNSLRTVSRSAGVSPTSLTRLVQALDFDSYEAFQAQHRDWLKAGREGMFSGRAGRLISGARAPGAENGLLDVSPQIAQSRENQFTASYRQELAHFVEAVREDSAIDLPAEQTILMRIVEGAYRSAEKESEVRF